jgi:hypothetical protein
MSPAVHPDPDSAPAANSEAATGKPRKGDRVRIVSGRFAGREGVWLRMHYGEIIVDLYGLGDGIAFRLDELVKA